MLMRPTARTTVLSPIYGRIFDYIIMESYQDKLMSCEQQFGSKARRLTNRCTMVLKESTGYHTTHDSRVFCTIPNATKAFDRQHYYKLFKLLMKRNLPAHIISVLINLFMHN